MLPRRPDSPAGLRFARSDEDALFTGVAGGLAERLGVDAVVVRIAFVLLSFAGAVGVVAYLVAWTISLDPGDRRAPPPRPASPTQSLALGAIVLGVVLLLRQAGLWLGDPVGIPLVIAAVGAGLIYVGSGKRQKRASRAAVPRRPPLVNVVLGGLLVVGGVAWFLTTNRSFEGLVGVLVSVIITAAGLGVVFGPWAYRLVKQLAEENHERIRSEERAELAAHLHDSVLQTLALIQRNASSPRKMASLARRQERELRAWLYGQPSGEPGLLGAAVQEIADAIEESHEVSVDVVVVGDCELDEPAMAVAHACREAATNAARHSGADEISVYVECEPERLTAFVRDRGKGFDPASLDADGRGIPDSIHGRIERHGGRVAITAAPGEGCEVQITMPLARS